MQRCLQELCHICRTGIVLGIGQAGRICKMGVLHTKLCGLLVHQCGKVILTAAHQLRQSLTAFCAGGQHRTIEQVPHRDCLPGRKACHRCFFDLQGRENILRQCYLLIQIRLCLNCQQYGHHFGQRSRRSALVSTFLRQYLPALGVQQDRVSAGCIQQNVLPQKQYQQHKQCRQNT